MPEAQATARTEEETIPIVAPQVVQTAHERFGDPKNFINRELSWLEFDRRVLEEAQDPTQPLIERVKFLTIVSSNLDEFFEIRVAGIKQQIESETSDIGPDGLSPTETFDRIQKTVRQLVAAQYALWNNELLAELGKNAIYVREIAELSPKRAAWAHRYFQQEVFPMLTPLAVDASHPLPHLLNRSHNLLVRAKTQRRGEPMHAIVQVPRAVSRLIALPRGKGADEPWEYIYLASLIKQHIGELFPGLILDGVHAFRVTRNSDLYIDDEEAENLLRTIEQELRRSSRGNAVRLEVEADCPKDFVELLLRFFNLSEADAYKLDGPLSMTHLAPLVANDAFAKLKDRPFQPARDPAVPPHTDFFEVLRRQDVLLHHPYDSFDQIVELIEQAATDPQVLAIKITLYRTSGDSPIVGALIDAANAGKQVTAIVELRARFDEASNIQWARRLEEAGAHVIYGVVGLKTHSKALLIVRRDTDQLRRYVHLGTGNYHSRTARIYTDFSLLTSEPQLSEEVATVFNTLTGLAGYPGLKKMMVAPFDMHSRLIKLIERERDNAQAGKPARIVAKLNALVDQEIIEKLYEASCAEVTINLIVRGICCLRPKIPDLSENIRVISIVGRFLEHSRIFHFENAGQPRVFLSSADWMPRNFYRRIELAFPVENPALRDQIINEVLPSFWNDRVKARELQPNGTYRRLKPEGSEPRAQAQWHFREVSRERAKKMTGSKKKSRADKLIPITVASDKPAAPAQSRTDPQPAPSAFAKATADKPPSTATTKQS
ncbi:MAG: polyphosphate kinase 1 [Verrucomicrobia bacterium]|nr:MAG: polyphosphate kinase 1 [Verrucomicrobiota bacterium]